MPKRGRSAATEKQNFTRARLMTRFFSTDVDTAAEPFFVLAKTRQSDVRAWRARFVTAP